MFYPDTMCTRQIILTIERTWAKQCWAKKAFHSNKTISLSMFVSFYKINMGCV